MTFLAVWSVLVIAWFASVESLHEVSLIVTITIILITAVVALALRKLFVDHLECNAPLRTDGTTIAPVHLRLVQQAVRGFDGGQRRPARAIGLVAGMDPETDRDMAI